jgi:dienelactone hydrolase
MKVLLFSLTLLVSFSSLFADDALPKIWNESMVEEWKKIDISVKSTIDGTMQPASFYISEEVRNSGKKVPLLVALHSWSFGYEKKDPASLAATEAAKRGWAMLYPHFRGPNKTPQACGSDLAVQDIVDQINWAIANHPIDVERVYIMGGSGGGHMALLMAGRHPEIFAAVYASCPITDIARWQKESSDIKKNLFPSYAKMIVLSCEGKPDEKKEEYARRSPLTYLSLERTGKLPVSIITGIHDGHKKKGGGSVPVGHAIRAYNQLVPAGKRLSENVISYIERTEKIPDKLKFEGVDPYFSADKKVLMRLTCGNARLTLFNAGHAGNYSEGVEWLSLQRRGAKANWNVPLPSSSVEASHITK